MGRDFDEVLLEQMATRGGGHFYFVQSGAQIPDYMAGEVGEALQVVARDAALQVDLPHGAELTVVNDLPVAPYAGGVSVGLGSLVSGQLFDAVLAVRFSTGADGEEQRVGMHLTDRDGAFDRRQQTAVFTYAPHKENDGQARDRSVDLEVARTYATRARTEDLEHNRRGDYRAAPQVLRATARRIREYAFNDMEFLALADELDGRLPQYSAAMAPESVKLEHAMAYGIRQSRGPAGQARRRRH